jgi:hypothetical protein
MSWLRFFVGVAALLLVDGLQFLPMQAEHRH